MDRDFKGVWIPREVWLAKDVPIMAKVLFVEIDSFTRGGGECYASNEYFSEFLGVSQRQVSEYIGVLINKGWVEQTRFDGRKRYLRSCMEVCFSGESKESSNESGSFLPGSHEENFYHNNIYNNINNNPFIKPPAEPEKEQEKAQAKRKETQPDFIDTIVSIFSSEYEKSRKIRYVVNKGKDRMAAQRILAEMKKANPGASSEQMLIMLQAFFARVMMISDKWIYDAMSLSIVFSQINKIRVLLKGGTNGARQATSDEEIANIMLKHFGQSSPDSPESP